jgi:AraC family transcriptional regulator, transcriptional activator of pobA
MRAEINSAAPAQYEMLVSYLKIFLITVSKLKMEQQPKTIALIPDLKAPFILQKLRDRLEKDFRKKQMGAPDNKVKS